MAHTAMQSMKSNEAMQKFMLLSSQQEALRRRLSLHVPSVSPTTASSPELQSLSSSPTNARPVFSSSWTPESDYHAAYPTATEPIPAPPDMAHRPSLDEANTDDSSKLYYINQQIKATLTELLNTDSVRSDEKYRAWIQGRLMDAEHQIRQQKRRRSSGSPSEREFALSIAEHLDLGFASSKTWD